MGDSKLEFDVPEDARLARCRSCGAGVYWIVTAAGRRMPLSARTLHEPEAGRRVAQSHFADCPNAAAHRKGGMRP